jgi:ribosomal protein L19
MGPWDIRSGNEIETSMSRCMHVGATETFVDRLLLVCKSSKSILVKIESSNDTRFLPYILSNRFNKIQNGSRKMIASRKLVQPHGVFARRMRWPLPAAFSTTGFPSTTAVRLNQMAKDLQAFDTQGRMKLLDKKNPERIQAGSIVQIQSLTSKTKEKPVVFAGIVIGIRHKGVDSSIILRNFVMKTGVEQTYKVFSPMITSIKVLQPKDDKYVRNKLYYLRECPEQVKWLLDCPILVHVKW